MRVTYIGNYNAPHTTETHLAATLESLGHEVFRIQENGAHKNWFDLALGSDLVLFTRTWNSLVTLDHLERLRKAGVPSVSYHLDLYVGLKRKYMHGNSSLEYMLHNDPFWRTDFVFTPDGDPNSREIFKENGVNHYYMKPGVYEPECYLLKPGQTTNTAFEEGVISDLKWKYEVLFVGSGDRPGGQNGYGHKEEWPYRDKLVGWLYDNYGERFTKFGHPQRTIRNEELNQLYADSKVVVGDSICIDFNRTYYWSDRIYETLGRGGFLIHPYIKGLEEEFTDKETIVFYEYGNFDQLRGLIDYYLEHDEERERIRLAGHEFVKNNATYTDRLKKMIDIVFNSPDRLTTVPGTPIKINLGAGNEIEKGWVNLDIVQLPGIDVLHNLLHYPWPFEDNVADYIKAQDVIEHMPTHSPDGLNNIVAFINECYRILKPGGTLWIQTPRYDADFLYIDPTHTRGFHEQSFDFFDDSKAIGQSTGFFSKARFNVTCKVLANKNLQFTMVKK